MAVPVKVLVYTRLMECCRTPPSIYDHGNTSGHCISVDNFSIVGTEGQSITRTIKEDLYIRVNDPSLHRNFGKFQLLYIWHEVLLNTFASSSSHALLVALYNGPHPNLPHVEKGYTFCITPATLLSMVLHQGSVKPSFGTICLPLYLHWYHMWQV